ncbi:cytochrome c5 family protein [Photobacterium makurazakiensis]|uniref:c-type cytochrome n=1 Tax=Photobacterium makurazakiensis TaxID=2910234 RepID=UPI003D14D696
MELTLRQLMVAAITAITLAGTAVAADMSDEAIAERIKPVGSVYLEGEAPTGPAVAAGPRSGDAVYGTFCAACHGSGLMGAPKKGEAADWDARLAKGNDVLADHAINGFNAMPAKGSCMDCSDDEIIAAINHMIDGL